MLGRALDDSYGEEIRSNLTLITAARLSTNSVYRFVIPFLAVLARGVHVNIAEIGIALMLSELTGLGGTAVGRWVDRGSYRVTMFWSLIGLSASATVVAFSRGIWLFGAGLILLGVSKLVFDVSLTGWVAEHVAATGRGRVFGIIEMSWAAGLFIGVTLLGLLTAISSWRWAYGCSAVVLLVTASVILRRLPHDLAPEHRRVPDVGATRGRASGRGWQFLISMGLMLMSMEMMIVVLGPWLQDEHGFGSGQIAGVTFGLGVFELLSSAAAIRLTDRWGGWRSVMRGGFLLIPASVLFTLGHRNLVVGLSAFVITTLGFEYCIISSFSVATTLVPGAPAAGLGLMITVNTFGRSGGTLLSTWLYDHHGPAAAVTPVMVTATLAFLLLAAGVSSQGRPAGAGARAVRT